MRPIVSGASVVITGSSWLGAALYRGSKSKSNVASKRSSTSAGGANRL
jgi:hypothetical protein